MDKIEQARREIKSVNYIVYEQAKKRLREQAKPMGSLGMLEDISARLASISGTLDVKLLNKIIVICAGDHGVVEEGVSLFPAEVTSQMVLNFVNGGASINVIAKHADADVKVVDLGVNYDFSKKLDIFHKKIAKGTKNFAKEPAMTREQAVTSIEAGISIIDELSSLKKIDLLGTGDMGIGNTTSSTAIIAVFSGVDAGELTGRGTGIDDISLLKKIEVIKRGLHLWNPDPFDPIDVLSKVGGFEIGGLAGLVIGAAKHGIPILCDGLISTAGALIACKLIPDVKQYLFASHRSVERGHTYMHKELSLTPVLDLQFRLGEGTGAALAMELLDLSTRILADIKTFKEVSINDTQT